MFKTLSVIIPVFNEKNTIEKCINRVLNADTCGLKLEIIISDNNSTDGTKKILQKIKDEKIKICYKSKNTGKGANMKNGLREANGDIILFQDADLEYSPENYPDLLKPILNEHADVVYGSRLTRAKLVKIVGFPNYIGNKIFTFFSIFFLTQYLLILQRATKFLKKILSKVSKLSLMVLK